MGAVLVDAAAILLGTLIGCLLKKIFNEHSSKVVMQALGIATIAIGIGNLVGEYNVLILALSLTIGGYLGSIMHIEHGIDKLGNFLQRKLSKNGSAQNTIGIAFVNATLIFCIGSMAVFGSIQAGLGNNETLYLKSILDFAMSVALASTLGWGVGLSAIVVVVFQGAFALGGELLQPIITSAFTAQLSAIGGALLLCIGINILEIKKIYAADLMPALLGSIVVLFI